MTAILKDYSSKDIKETPENIIGKILTAESIRRKVFTQKPRKRIQDRYMIQYTFISYILYAPTKDNIKE